jgi:hypothetical protein
MEVDYNEKISLFDFERVSVYRGEARIRERESGAGFGGIDSGARRRP